MLPLTQKWALWNKPFGNFSLPKLGNVVAKLPRMQATLGELGEDRRLGAAVAIISQATKTIFWTENYEIAKLSSILKKICLLHRVIVHPVSLLIGTNFRLFKTPIRTTIFISEGTHSHRRTNFFQTQPFMH
jgi:hypothetical protein